MYFSKLNKNIKVTEDNFKKSIQLTSYGKRINYFRAELLNINLKEIIPERYRIYFLILVMEVYNDLPPHIDDGTKASINFYITPSNCITYFYEIIEDKPIHITGSNGGKVFDKKHLEEVGKFIAQKDEVWILDVSKPHSVISLNEIPETRLAVCLQTTKFNYEQVTDMLRESGYL